MNGVAGCIILYHDEIGVNLFSFHYIGCHVTDSKKNVYIKKKILMQRSVNFIRST